MNPTTDTTAMAPIRILVADDEAAIRDSYRDILAPRGAEPQAAGRNLVPVILATLQLIGEGFDCPGLDSLLIVTPVRFSGRLKQVVGRVLRPAEGKIPVVIDYHDSRVGLLSYQAKCGRRVYRELS